MPTYTLKDIKTNEQWDVYCSHEDLETILDEMPDIIRVWKPVSFITGTDGSTLKKAGNEWNNFLTKAKNKYPGSTINT